MKYGGGIVDDNLKKHKRKRRKKRLAVIGIALIVFFAALSAAYKIIMTPSRAVHLSLLNTGKECIKSFEYITDDDSIGIIKDVLSDGGTANMTLKLEKSPVLSGVDADIICTSDGNTAISEIKFNPLMKFETYKDNEEFLINVPLIMKGIQVPLKNFGDDYDNSIFKNKIKIDQNSEGNKAVAGVFAAIAAKGFYDRNKEEIINWITDIEFSKDGKDSVKIGDKERNADVYTAEISEAKMKELKKLASDYFNTADYSERIKNTANSKIDGFANDYTVQVKVKMYKIREIVIISSDGTMRVIKLTGKSKPSYDIIYYEEGCQNDELRRIHTDKGSGTDEILKGEKDIFVLNKDGGKMSVKTNYNGIDIDLNTDSIKTSGDTAKMENISLTLNNTVTVSGDISMSKKYDYSLTFEKENSYIDLLKTDESSWQGMVDVVVSSIQLIKGKL